VNRFMDKFTTGGASEGEIEGGANFDGRELCVKEEERMWEKRRRRRGHP
jgi:hypothetical protein